MKAGNGICWIIGWITNLAKELSCSGAPSFHEFALIRSPIGITSVPILYVHLSPYSILVPESVERWIESSEARVGWYSLKWCVITLCKLTLFLCWQLWQKIKALSRPTASQQAPGSSVSRQPRNLDPALHPFERARGMQALPVVIWSCCFSWLITLLSFLILKKKNNVVVSSFKALDHNTCSVCRSRTKYISNQTLL